MTAETTAGVLDDLGELYEVLRTAGYTVIGPTVQHGAIVLAELSSASELPFGWGVDLKPGGYRLRRRADEAAFAHSSGPQSWKPFLHPPRTKLWEADRTAEGFDVRPGTDSDRAPRYAFLGVRPCDLRAIQIQDRVLTGGRHADPVYQGRRTGTFIIAVNCTEPGAACFCASMDTGPEAGPGYDVVLTELVPGPHEPSRPCRFLVQAGSEAGEEMLARLRPREADDETAERARTEVAAAADRMGREMPVLGLRELMAESLDSPHWDDVAERCLSCGNCTMVCPTCFCTTVTDVTDVTDDHAERWSVWDSCFDRDFSFMHGGSVRASATSRYRQWLTHKLGTWHDQFGMSGCVGCGRCIVWCPVGIDLTAEVTALRDGRREGSHDEHERHEGHR